MRDTEGGGPAEPLLATDSYEIIPGPAEAGLLVLCDHAGNAFPPGYGTLGLPEAQLRRHIAYDIGAAGVVRRLSAALGGTAVLSRYSRLLIDLNRGADDPTLVMRLSDGAIVPGNHPIGPEEIAERTRLYYRPYHRAVDWTIERSLAAGVRPIIVSVHSFTEAWKGVPRPWQVGILWARDRRLPGLLLDRLTADPALIVGDNEPYSGELEGDCMDAHATRRGLAHALIEIRQDLIADDKGQAEWAERFAGLLSAILADPHHVEMLRAPFGKAPTKLETPQ